MSIEDSSTGLPKSAQSMSSGLKPIPCAVSSDEPSSFSQLAGPADVDTEVTRGAGR